MLPGESRRGSAGPTMVPIHAPPPKGEATMVHFTRSGVQITPFGSQPKPEETGPGAAPIVEAPETSYDPERNRRAVSAVSVRTFTDELRSVALMQGLDFSIIQPDSMKIDFFTESRALRVNFTGREIAINRIVVKEILTPPDTQVQPLQGLGSARKRLLDQERDGFDPGQVKTKVRVATIRDKKYGVLEWNDRNTLEKAETAVPEGLVAIEARYFDAEERHNCFIEMINDSPALGDEQARAGRGELTPKAARWLVMLLLNSLRSITGPKSSL